MSTVPTTRPKQACILQFNQIKGVHEGAIDQAHHWSQNPVTGSYLLETKQQKAVQTSNDFMFGEIDPKTNKITWSNAIMLEVKTKAVHEEESESIMQKWSMEHKKNMVSQFGTSKSKRKINQMMSNIIS